MIVVEDVCAALFDQLPVSVIDGKNYKVRFGWGSQDTLNLHIKQNGQTLNKYPLIWLVESEEKVYGASDNELVRDCTFIIAVNSKHATNTNPIIWQTEFNPVLNPLAKNIIKAFDASGITQIMTQGDLRYRLTRYSNYSAFESTNDGKKTVSKTIDNWNVIILTMTVNFTQQPSCIQQINFN